ncbi:MAG: hypothetical protein AAF907_12325, partial [Planctomycetota bacterium]
RRDMALVGHPGVGGGIYELLIAAEKLPPEDRFRLLAEVVLPLPVDPYWRSDHRFSPADPPPGTDLPGERPPEAGRRVPTGGRMLSPAAMLLETAAELGRLEELAETAASLPAPPGLSSAKQAGLLAAIAARTGGDPAPHVKRLEDYLSGLKKDARKWEPPPVLIAARNLADAAQADPSNVAARDAARRLSESYLKTFQNNFGGDWFVLKRQARDVLADTLENPPLGEAWVAAPEASLLRASQGAPAARWVGLEGDPFAVDHRTGGERDRLFAVRPLSRAGDGALSLTATPAVGWFRNVRVMLNGLGVQLDPGRDAVSARSHSKRLGKPAKLKQPLKDGSQDYELTQTLTDSAFTASIDGFGEVWTRSLKEKSSEGPLPFLALQARGDYGDGGVRGLSLSGKIETPETVDLLPADHGRIPDWWLDAYSAETGAGRNVSGWLWKDDGLSARAKPVKQSGGPDEETLLVFPRPLAASKETVRFEFFDEADAGAAAEGSDAIGADRAGVHVALGRIAFVLTDAGVR